MIICSKLNYQDLVYTVKETIQQVSPDSHASLNKLLFLRTVQ